MKCVICRTGETQMGTVTVTLQRGETVILIKGVPAQVCEDCGEYYLDESVTQRVYALAEEAVQRHAEVEILRYAA
jgi:YgiT-type zinc finger domain-containing protein